MVLDWGLYYLVLCEVEQRPCKEETRSERAQGSQDSRKHIVGSSQWLGLSQASGDKGSQL